MSEEQKEKISKTMTGKKRGSYKQDRLIKEKIGTLVSQTIDLDSLDPNYLFSAYPKDATKKRIDDIISKTIDLKSIDPKFLTDIYF